MKKCSWSTRILLMACLLWMAEVNSQVHCNMSVLPFLNIETGLILIPSQIEGKRVHTATALIHFRESHGGFQSCFSLKQVKTQEIIELFCETRFSDKNMRGDDDWLGSEAGGILGEAPYVREVALKLDKEYALIVSGYLPPHKVDARSAKTNFRDPVPDGNDRLFTSQVSGLSKSVPLLGHPDISTIIGFEDGYKNEKIPDYNDVVIEMCLQITY